MLITDLSRPLLNSNGGSMPKMKAAKVKAGFDTPEAAGSVSAAG